MTAFGHGAFGSCRRAHARGSGSSPARLSGLAAGLAVAFGLAAGLPPARAADPAPLKIVVFDFELNDSSAGGDVIAPDAADREHLKNATDEARRLLAEAGGYSLVAAAGAADDLRAAGGIRHCNGCEAALAAKLGAGRSLAGLITRVTRTEYTLQLLLRDARSGDLLANAFTGLRMGANYSWPRGVRSLMNERILTAQHPQ